MVLDTSSSSSSSSSSSASSGAHADDRLSDFSSDQIRVLLQREDRYLCEDYTASTFRQQQESPEDDRDFMMDTSATSAIANNNTTKNILRRISSTASIRDVQAERRSSATGAATTAPSATTPLHHQQHEEFAVWRQQMFDWSIMVVDSLGADRETVAACFSLLDRFLVTELKRAKAPPVTRDDYQLFAMTCLYICTKVLDPYPHMLSVLTLVDMSKQYYTSEVIEQTEMDILNALDWKIHAPTALTYARLYTDLLRQHHQQQQQPPLAEVQTTASSLELSLVQLTMVTEIAVSSGQFVSCRPSIVGLAAVLLSAVVDHATPQLLPDFLLSQASLLPQDGDEFRHVYTLLEKLCS